MSRTILFRFIIYVFLFLSLPVVAATGGASDIKKPIMQDSDPNAANYFNNRRALVGPACMVNSVFDGVQVLEGVKDLQNICNEDLNDYAVMPSAVTAGVAASPIISIKDTHCYYAGNTQAGFTICANSDAGLLKLDLATFYKIQFYKDGEAVGDMKSVETEKGITGLGLSLLSIPGSSMVNKTFVATAPGDFDEIKLFYCGVDVNAISSINIKYAFVGSAREYTITNNKENGIAKYAQEQGRQSFTLKTGLNTSVEREVIDENLNNGFVVSAVLKLGTSLPITVIANPSDNEEAFPAGTEVGFKYNSTTILEANLVDGAKLTLYDRNGNSIGNYPISATVLKLGAIEVSKDGELSLKAPKAFSQVKLEFPGVLSLKLGYDKVNYAFVRMAPDKASHHCPIEATADREVCGCENEFLLEHNPDVDVTWSVVEQPNGSNVVLDPKSGRVTDVYVPGKYTFRATASDGCWEETTINYAPHVSPAEQGVVLLVNNEGAGKTKYVLSGNDGGALLNIFGSTEESNKILSSDLNSCAAVQPGVTLAGLKDIVGIKTADNSHIVGNVFDYKKHKMKAGFVVSSKVTGLNLDVLKFFTIELRKNGVKVINAPTSHWGAISAGLIGSEAPHKIRLTIDVPDGCDFDEIVLQDAGVLGADLSKLNIYYAYVSNADQENSIDNILYGGVPVSWEKTNATIDYSISKPFSVANIGNGYDQWSNLIDTSFDTSMTFPLGVDLGGAVLAVNIGRKVNPGQPIVMVTSKLKLGLNVKLGDGLKLATYLDGTLQEELTNWNVLGADVISEGGSSYAMLKPEKPFNQVRITQANLASALGNIQIQGFAICSSVNEDGTLPDCQEKLLVLDEDSTLNEKRTFKKARLVFHRTFNKEKWNSLILPVSMNAKQLAAAFGDGTLISKYDKVEGRYILFEPITAETNGVILEANVPYIICPKKDPEMVENKTYDTGDNIVKIITGPVYSVTGINYTDQTAHLRYDDKANCTVMTHYGSYERPTAVPTGSYMLNGGDLYHTAREHNVKAYRCWLEVNSSAGSKPAGFSLQMAFSKPFDDTSTGIRVIEENALTGAKGIYSISGMRMNQRNGGSLPKGIYIINNKKVIVK